MLRIWKSAHYGKIFESQIVNNMWFLQCCPNGNSKENKGLMNMAVRICSMPPGVNRLKINWSIKCVEINDGKNTDY